MDKGIRQPFDVRWWVRGRTAWLPLPARRSAACVSESSTTARASAGGCGERSLETDLPPVPTSGDERPPSRKRDDGWRDAHLSPPEAGVLLA